MTWKWLIIYIYLPLSSIELFLGSFFIWPWNPLKFWVFFFKQFRTQNFFHETQTSNDLFFVFIPTWNVEFIRKKGVHWSFIWECSHSYEAIFCIKWIILTIQQHILHVMKKECEITISFGTLNYSISHLIAYCMRRQIRSRMRLSVGLARPWKSGEASFGIIWSESVFMGANEFANERIKMSFQMRQMNKSGIVLAIHAKCSEWGGWGPGNIAQHSTWWWWW